MIRSHKIRLSTNKTQDDYFRRSCGCARHAYNWALGRTKDILDQGGKPNDSELKKEFNRIKAEEFPWQLEVTKCAAESALANLRKAKQGFFKKKAKFPTFHKKGRNESFTIDNTKFRVAGNRIRIPKLGWVKMREELRFEGKLMSATVSCVAGRWFVSIAVEFEAEVPTDRENQVVGVDLGIKDFVVLSIREKVSGPKALKSNLKRLRGLNKALSRKQKGSNRRRKAKRRLSRLHWRISCIRDDFFHKLSTRLVGEYTVISVEDLNVKGMMSNRRLARHIADQGFKKFRGQLEYKAKAVGTEIVVADRFCPSSKTCNVCGAVYKGLKLSERT